MIAVDKNEANALHRVYRHWHCVSKDSNAVARLS
jgi:hypothetical protein